MAITTVLSNLHIPQRLRSLGNSSAQKELEQLKQEARQSLLELEYLYSRETPPLQLVAFYAAVSPWSDRSAELYQLERALARIDYGQHNKARQALVSLAAQEERDPYGLNQTMSGEIPSAENVFLGERYGLCTDTVAYWEVTRAKYTNQPAIIGRPHPTVMEVIDAQASGILASGLNRWNHLFQALIDS